MDKLISCLLIEIEKKKNYLGGEEIETVYFGGGTPSILGIDVINKIIRQIETYHSITGDPEITLEANPDDLSDEYLESLKKNTIVNRLSLGIQSFRDNDLIMMNRRHNSKKAVESIEKAIKYGFENLSIDLIYGIPCLTAEAWKENLLKAFSFKIKHLSAYHLTFEPGTVFYNRWKSGKLPKPEEEESVRQFELLIDIAENHHFIQYEISNFAPDGFYARHNTNYWLQKKYLGIGPSAHSYDLNSRHWNISDNAMYIKNVLRNQAYFDSETLDKKMKFNEFLMTRLRTVWGIDLTEVSKEFGDTSLACLEKAIKKFEKDGILQKENNNITFTKKGKFLSDFVITELMQD